MKVAKIGDKFIFCCSSYGPDHFTCPHCGTDTLELINIQVGEEGELKFRILHTDKCEGRETCCNKNSPNHREIVSLDYDESYLTHYSESMGCYRICGGASEIW